jgi:hypothetical protein
MTTALNAPTVAAVSSSRTSAPLRDKPVTSAVTGTNNGPCHR